VTFSVEVRPPAIYPERRARNHVLDVEADDAEEAAYLALWEIAHEDGLLGHEHVALRARPAADPGAHPDVFRPVFRAHVCPVTGERDGSWDVRRVYPRPGNGA
jgi:hypothetical protein